MDSKTRAQYKGDPEMMCLGMLAFRRLLMPTLRRPEQQAARSPQAEDLRRFVASVEVCSI